MTTIAFYESGSEVGFPRVKTRVEWLFKVEFWRRIITEAVNSKAHTEYDKCWTGA